ncbi:MAG: hypothetical protein QOD39_1843 [Mycobacterium sp.]|nr:hypothetical protein [Mycobacterium sp.]
MERLDGTEVVLTGQVTEQCILYTALDAYTVTSADAPD